MIKQIKKIKNSDNGVAGIVVTLMIIGLFVSAVAMVQTLFVPNWMEQKESEHMGEVGKQFTQLKFAIDTQALVAEKNIPVSTPITLGSDEMPFLTTMRSYGDINIMPNDCKITITYKSSQDPTSDESVTFKAGSIKYSSRNAYYMNQNYIYENGALILSQGSQSVMSVQPSLSVILNKDLSFTIFSISELGDKTSAAGYGTYPIQTKFLDSKEYIYSDITSITIETSHQNAWRFFFEDVLKINTDENNYDFDAAMEPLTDQDEVVITFSEDLPDLNIKQVKIGAQISPGWVE